MRIVFIGTVDFSYKMLCKLITLNANIVGLCTKENSNFNSDYKDLTPLCKKNNLPYKYVEDVNLKENIEWIKSCNPDVIFCFGWSSLIKKELLQLTRRGVIGYHPTKLPFNRGRHPLIWALVLGLKNSASTFFFMDEGADSGDILSQEEFEILYEDNAQSLYEKVSNIAQSQIEEFLPKLQNNSFKRIKQEHSISNTWRRRGINDGQIDFRMSSNAIYNLVRALSKPYVGAHIHYKDEDISIWKVEEIPSEKYNLEPGKVLEIIGNIIIVKTIDKAIKIVEHEFKTLPKKGEYL